MGESHAAMSPRTKPEAATVRSIPVRLSTRGAELDRAENAHASLPTAPLDFKSRRGRGRPHPPADCIGFKRWGRERP